MRVSSQSRFKKTTALCLRLVSRACLCLGSGGLIVLICGLILRSCRNIRYGSITVCRLILRATCTRNSWHRRILSWCSRARPFLPADLARRPGNDRLNPLHDTLCLLSRLLGMINPPGQTCGHNKENDGGPTGGTGQEICSTGGPKHTTCRARSKCRPHVCPTPMLQEHQTNH